MSYLVEAYLSDDFDNIITFIFKDKDQYSRLRLENDFFSSLDVVSKGYVDTMNYFYEENSDSSIDSI